MGAPADPAAGELATLRDGSTVLLRPIGGADEPRLKDLLAHMSLEDIRHRFFAPIRELSPGLSWHLSHPDPQREVTVAALTPNGATLLGVARAAAEEGSDRAEYAIAVRTDFKGRGLGYLLLGRIIEAARARGLAALWGDVMRDNDAMLLMAREHGFQTADHPSEGDLVRVTKPL